MISGRQDPAATHLPIELSSDGGLLRPKLSTAPRALPPDDASVPMTGGAHTLERDEPVAKPEHGHHDHPDRLSQHRRNALGTHRLIGLSEQSDYGVAKILQSAGPGAAYVLVRCQRRQDTREPMFQRVGVNPADGGWASCPTRRRKATDILPWPSLIAHHRRRGSRTRCGRRDSLLAGSRRADTLALQPAELPRQRTPDRSCYSPCPRSNSWPGT